jgi:hypothetical protein
MDDLKNPVLQVELDEMFAEVCDIVERTRRGLPLRRGDGGTFHTSAEARAAAIAIGAVIENHAPAVKAARKD